MLWETSRNLREGSNVNTGMGSVLCANRTETEHMWKKLTEENMSVIYELRFN